MTTRWTPTERCYVLVETKRPPGYVLPAGDDAVTAVKVKVGDVTTDNVTIENTKAVGSGSASDRC